MTEQQDTTENTNSFIGESTEDSLDRIKDGLSLLKQILSSDQEHLTLNQQTMSGAHWLLTNLQNALTYEIGRKFNKL